MNVDYDKEYGNNYSYLHDVSHCLAPRHALGRLEKRVPLADNVAKIVLGQRPKDAIAHQALATLNFVFEAISNHTWWYC